MSKKINHIAILLDRSGSMQSLTDAVINQFNKQAAVINQRSREEGHETHLSMYTFGNTTERPLFEVPLDLVELRPITRQIYHADGMTAMYDCMGAVIEDLSHFHRDLSGDHGFLVIVLTDGEENASKKFGSTQLANLMNQKLGTDMWTFAILVPSQRYKDVLLQKLPINAGSVQEWSQTVAGVEEGSRITTQSLNNYFAARTQGLRSVKTFFTTDLSKVTAGDVASLEDVTAKFRKFSVEKECEIKTFCEYRAGSYVLGRAFYELTKKETVQPHKGIILEDRATGKLSSGPRVRSLLGMPSGGDVRIDPGNHANYRIYIQSTSVNRKLVRGTSVLYGVPDVRTNQSLH